MNFRLTAILFGTILLLAVVLLVMSYTGDTAPPTDILAEELAGTKPDEIDTLEIEKAGGGKIKIVRVTDPGKWNIVEPYPAKADPAAVDEVVGALLKAKPVAHPELSDNPAAHGLAPPGLKVTLRRGDQSSTINFGTVTVGGNKGFVFVTTSARSKRPMAVSRGAVDSLFREQTSGAAGGLAKGVGDFRSKQVFPAGPAGGGDDVNVVTLAARGKTLSLERSGRGWKFKAPAGWGEADPAGDVAAAPNTFTGVSRLLGALTSLQALNAADFIDLPADPAQEAAKLKEYGLDDGNPDRVKVDLQTRDGQKTVALIGKKDPASAPPPLGGMHGMPETGKYWVRVEGQAGVIRANAGDLSGLIGVIENPDPLRDRNLLTADKVRIDGLDLANGATKLRKSGTGPLAAWKLYGNPGDPQGVSLTEVERVLNALTERRTVRSFPPPNDANFGPGAVVVKVWADAFEAPADPKAEPKERKGAKPTTLTFGKKEGDAVHVRRVLPDDTADHFLLPEKIKVGASPDPVDVLALANKPRLDLLDRDLKGFAAANAAKLTVQGVVNFDLDRDEKPDLSAGGPAWRFAADAKGPAGQAYRKGDRADETTVQGMLDILATTLSATRVVDENPTPEKLAGYGLGTATRLRVTVGLRGTAPDDKERVYEFGKETADPNLVYAQQRGKTAVLTLPKFIYDKFPTADLRDRAIFHVDQAQVTRVEVTGWGNLFGAPAELVVEKNKEGVWTATKAPTAGYVADPGKVIGLLRALDSLEVKTFTNEATAEPKHGLGDNKQVFVITLATAAGAHHLHLRLGGPADPDGRTLYALTNRVPDGKPIVTVDAAPFKAYREGPAAFSK